MVEMGKSALGVAESCRLLGIPRSSYYANKTRKPSSRSARCRVLVAHITAVFEEHEGRYGCPRIFRALRKKDILVTRKTVARLMRQEQLVCRPKRRFRPMTTDSKYDGPIAPNLLEQNFHAALLNTAWVGDITYVRTDDGWVYLAVVIDLFSRRVVGWAMSASPNAQLVVHALQIALTMRRPAPGLIVHSDRGVQYASDVYRKLLGTVAALPSMSRTGNCYDNAVAESFSSTLEHELRCRYDFLGLRDAEQIIGAYIDNYYNRRRMHSTLDYKSPSEYELCARAAA
jgi:putative transposase